MASEAPPDVPTVPPEQAIDDLDESELLNENAEMHLFTWLAATEQRAAAAPLDYLRARQPALERTLLAALAGPPFPPPGRALRSPVARTLAILYRRADARPLFDTLQACFRIAGDAKTPDRDVHRIAAFAVAGALMAEFGAQVLSCMAELTNVALRTAKSSGSPLLRSTALTALRDALTTARRAVPPATTRDILKQAKAALTDRALPVQRAAAAVLIALHPPGDGPPVPEAEAILALVAKSLEAADAATRHALARLAGHALAATQAPRAPPAPDAPAKGRRDAGVGARDADDAPPPAEPPAPLLAPAEMLALLGAHWARPHATRRARAGLGACYAALLAALGPAFVAANYGVIAAHLMGLARAAPRVDALLDRRVVGVLLRDLVGGRMLSEAGQVAAIQELATACLKRWPAMMPGQVAPTPAVLTIALDEVAGLLEQLGTAPPPVQDALGEPLLALLAHPTHTVRIAAAWALRRLCAAAPLRLPRALAAVMDHLQRALAALAVPTAPPDAARRALGHAHALAALVALLPARPLYAAPAAPARVLDLALAALKGAGAHAVRVGATEVEAAWAAVAALAALGPPFVRAHLPQLLVLWRNALPRPPRAAGARAPGEAAFLLHVRGAALGALRAFLRHNGALVTLDVARRVASVLGNALLFAEAALAEEEAGDGGGAEEAGGLPVRARAAVLRARVYECYAALGGAGVAEGAQGALLQGAVALLAGPDAGASAVQAAVAAAGAGAGAGVWGAADGYAHGVTALVLEEDAAPDARNADAVEAALDALVRTPVLGALEHDPLALCGADSAPALPPPPATAVVDAAVVLAAQLLPLQDAAGATKAAAQLAECARAAREGKNAGRRAAVALNTVVMLVRALRGVRGGKAALGSAQVTALLAPLLQEAVVDGDPVLRAAGSEALGRLASLADTAFLTAQAKTLVDTVVGNREPHARAGCALALGALYAHVGGLAAGPLLKTTVNVLMSLGADPHPVVHFWALRALAHVVDAASLAYAPFVPGTLGMLLRVCALESHERAGGTPANANAAGDVPADPAVGQILDAVITVLGPDLQDAHRTRALVLALVHELASADAGAVCVEAVRCEQHLLMFAPGAVSVPALVARLRAHLAAPRRALKPAATDALYQLVQRDALALSRLGGDRLVEDLFGMLDDDPGVDGVRKVIRGWLQQTAVHNPSAWIDLCQRIMSRTAGAPARGDAGAGPGARDDEGASLNLGAAGAEGTHLASRWRTQLFALQCLHDICTTVAAGGRRELLVSRVPDLIRMAFTASAAHVAEIRLEGLVVLRDVIETFATTPDPAYEGALLLEQHQAPITAALTPAFSADSTPEILASAVNACAVFVGCGVVRDVHRMGRILKLLTAALEQSKDSGTLSLGDVPELSPNASAMLRISTLSAWAELEIASAHQKYLVDVVAPYRPTLATLWIAALRDYASIRVDSEFLQDASSAALDSSYASLGREVLLPYYTEAWPVVLQAIAAAMQAGDPHILAAMDGQELEVNAPPPKPTPRNEPTAFFFIFFGLVFEALATSSAEATSTATSPHPTMIAALDALKYLVRPEYSGRAMLEPTTSDEFISMCYRIAMTEPAVIQVHLVDMLAALAVSQSPKAGSATTDDELSLTSSPAHCLRICSYILRHAVSSSRGPIIQGEPDDRIRMINAAFASFSTVATTIQSAKREDVRGVALLLYSELLKDESSEIDIVGPTLPSLKALLDIPGHPSPDAREKYSRQVHGLLSACLLNIDGMRGREGIISTKKIKNNLLAAVLILTVIPQTAKVGRSAIEHCCFLICQKLLEGDEISLTAVHCAKTLILASTSGNAMLFQCAKLLIPGLIEYIAKMAPLVIDESISESQVAAIGEVWKAFSAFFASVAEPHRVRALGVLLPTITMLLTKTTSSSPVNTQSVAQLLSYATSSPASFKEAASRLDPETRDILEQSVRRAVGGNTVSAAQSAAKPQISLRTF